MLGPTEIALIAGMFLLLFGPTLLPRAVRSITESVKEGRKAIKEVERIGADDE